MKKMSQAENNSEPYPSWICSECAYDNGGYWSEGQIATFHDGICEWCDEERAVTKPRYYGYPLFKGEKQQTYKMLYDRMLAQGPGFWG